MIEKSFGFGEEVGVVWVEGGDKRYDFPMTIFFLVSVGFLGFLDASFNKVFWVVLFQESFF